MIELLYQVSFYCVVTTCFESILEAFCSILFLNAYGKLIKFSIEAVIKVSVRANNITLQAPNIYLHKTYGRLCKTFKNISLTRIPEIVIMNLAIYPRIGLPQIYV